MDSIGKSCCLLGMQLPGSSLISGADNHVAAVGSGQIRPAVARAPSPAATRPATARRAAGARVVRRPFDVVRGSRMRSRERRMPLELDDHLLRDIGLTRAEYRFLVMSRALQHGL